MSEVLLQQTRVDQAARYYSRFLARFPDVRRLARAPLGHVLKAWEGAGYYARARHLHAAARLLDERYDGHLPDRVEALTRLPGVGPYVARAIAAIAFGQPVLALEANGLRVGARVTRTASARQRSAGRTRVAAFLTAALDDERPGPFHEALMELGQTVCRPRRPRCAACPVRALCRSARELADPAAIPAPPRRPARRWVRAAIAAVRWRRRWLVHRRPPHGLLGGLWEFPGGKIVRGETAQHAAEREWTEETGLPAPPLRPVGSLRHAYSHFTVELHVFQGEIADRPGPGPELSGFRWVSAEQFAELPRPRATVRALEMLAPGDRAHRGSGSHPGRTRP